MIRGLLVPADENLEVRVIEAENAMELRKQAHIEWIERVNTPQSHEHGFSAMCDDNGRDKMLPSNPRAQFLLDYQGALVCGNYIFMSEAMVDGGMDFVSLSDHALTWLCQHLRENYDAWRAEQFPDGVIPGTVQSPLKVVYPGYYFQ